MRPRLFQLRPSAETTSLPAPPTATYRPSPYATPSSAHGIAVTSTRQLCPSFDEITVLWSPTATKREPVNATPRRSTVVGALPRRQSRPSPEYRTFPPD